MRHNHCKSTLPEQKENSTKSKKRDTECLENTETLKEQQEGFSLKRLCTKTMMKEPHKKNISQRRSERIQKECKTRREQRSSS
jgi:hypothetical protein